MSRLSESFERLRREGGRGLVPFVTAGDPDLETTRALIVELARAGATAIELGVPFSDPVADGPVIQRASERALRHGFGIEEVLRTVAEARRETEVPLVLFSYYNPLMQFGVERLARESREAGADAVLVTDLVPEEAVEFNSELRSRELDQVFLVAPTSTDARLRLAAERCGGFIYAVSRAGVTGARETTSAEAEKLVGRVRAFSSLPVAVGFGISTREQVAEVWRYAEAAVVGSALVAEMERNAGEPELVARAGRFLRSLLPGAAEV